MKRLIVHRNIALLATISMVVLSLFMLNIARANSLSWTTGIPTTVYSDEVSPNDDWNNSCASKFHNIRDQRKIEGVEDQSRQYNTECLIGSGDNYQLFEGNDGKLAVSFAGESNAHVINSGASCFYGCVYMPSRDYLISIQSPGTFGDGKLVIFKDFVKRLHMQRITLPNLRVETYFTGEQSPDEILTDRFITEDFSTTTKHLQRSQNDKWLVFELVGRGMYRIDMDTGNTTKFLYLTTKYWDPGTAPSMQIDVSNDGRHVAIFGRNTSNAIYELTPDCGFTVPSDPAQIKALERQGQPTTECPALYLATPMNDPANNTYMPNLQVAYLPQFSDDGGEISFYATNSTDPIHHISLRAANYTGPQPLDYLALGDSYSSGEGDTTINWNTNQKYYRKGTDINGSETTPREKCHVSTHSYPYLLAQTMNLQLALGGYATGKATWQDISCSGATAWDVKRQGSDAYAGQGDRLKNFNLKNLKSQALHEFLPGRQKQVEFIKTYKPKVITLTMGGNDVDFAGKLQDCAGLTSFNTCSWARADQDRDRLASEIASQFDNLTKLYKELYDASDHQSKIYVIGYPQFISDDENASCPVNIGLLNYEERHMINQAVTYLNLVIEKAAKNVGVKYINIENSLDGHRLCDVGNSYVNGITDVNGVLRNLGIVDRYEQQESFHPDLSGNAAMRRAIMGKDNLNDINLLDYNNCPGSSANICPDQSATKSSIKPPQYFSAQTTRTVNASIVAGAVSIKGNPTSVILDAYAMSPGSTAIVTLHSNPISVGFIDIDSRGGTSTDVTLPIDTPVGYHTILISGMSYSGDPITYEQTILVKGPNVNDVNENGIDDSKEGCIFITPMYHDIDKDGVDDACDPRISDDSNNTATAAPPSSIYTYTLTASRSLGGDFSNKITSSIFNSQSLASSTKQKHDKTQSKSQISPIVEGFVIFIIAVIFVTLMNLKKFFKLVVKSQ